MTPNTPRWRLSITLAAVLTSTGCMLGPGQTDEGSDIVSQLHITFPSSATNIVGAEHSVSFLMPNDQWRAYVAGY